MCMRRSIGSVDRLDMDIYMEDIWICFSFLILLFFLCTRTCTYNTYTYLMVYSMAQINENIHT